MPGVSLPMGADAAGLPLGLLLSGPSGGDDRVLRRRAVEAALSAAARRADVRDVAEERAGPSAPRPCFSASRRRADFPAAASASAPRSTSAGIVAAGPATCRGRAWRGSPSEITRR